MCINALFLAPEIYKNYCIRLRQLTPAYANFRIFTYIYPNLPQLTSALPCKTAPSSSVFPQFFLSFSSLKGRTKEQVRKN